jgi:hypothetical protein
MKNNEFDEFFGLINTTSERRFKAHQVKTYGYLRGAGEKVNKDVWKKSHKNKKQTEKTPKTITAAESIKKERYKQMIAELGKPEVKAPWE